MTKKVEINEHDLKKVILILKLSYPYLRYNELDNRLRNLWRVRDKLAKKLLKNSDLMIDSTKGRLTLRSKDDAQNV